MIVGLCDRFHCLPSQLLEENADIIRLLRIVSVGSRDNDADVEEF